MSKFPIYQEQIVHHLQNNSPSKYMFSFTKTPRFFRLKQDNKVDKFYNLPSTLTKRYTTMGFGKKININSNTTNSEFISIKRYFDKNYQPGAKYSFGISREKFTKVYFPGMQSVDLSIPGPGKYNLVGRPGLNSPKYTMRPKCVKKNINNSLSPGPANYSTVVNFNSEGKYPLSGMSNVHTINFGSNRTRRFFYKVNNIPGPGSYKIKGLFGKNFISKFKSGNFISIHKKLLSKKNDSDETPGPGAYSSFSEFGIPSLNTHKTLNVCDKIRIRKKILSANKDNIIKEKN